MLLDLGNTLVAYYSSAEAPAVLAASLAAVDLVDSPEGASLRRDVLAKSASFRSLLEDAGCDTLGSETPIVPVRVGDAGVTMEFSRRMLAAGIFVQGIRPPTVPAGTSRLRCTVMASHADADLERAAAAIVRIGRDLGVL